MSSKVCGASWAGRGVFSKAAHACNQPAGHAAGGCRCLCGQPKPRGNCYVTVEALFHLLGGKAAGWKPMTVRHEGDVHWFLVHESTGVRLDPTVSQFTNQPDYTKARGRGFLTVKPSKRARAMMDGMVWGPR